VVFAKSMKEAENKEIALLLKDLGRRQRSDAAIKESAANHLDADELSSFAEGVLPPATRALYAGHLADCDRCRSTVAKLAMAAGGAVETKTEQVPAAGLWRYFEGIFSQKLMRFAVPVMSIVILAAIAFVWFKREGREDRLAQTQTQEKTTQPIDSLSQPSPATGFFTGDSKNKQAKADSAGSQPAKEAKEKTDSKGAAADQETARNEGSGSKSKTTSADKPKEEARTTENTSVAAAAPAPPAASQPAPKPQTRGRDDAAKKPEPTPTDTVAKSEVKDEDKGEAADKREEAEKKKVASEDTAVRRAAGIGGFMSKRQTETKTVSGRRFMRQDNRWVDTAYQSSASLTNVTRNSEQFRALIGDEPGLRAIAEQLEGEVIVVWKGKAYRIR
jgi:hypothetical protein